MIKIFNFKKTNNFQALEKFLDKRRMGKNVDTSIVTKILNILINIKIRLSIFMFL